MDYYKILSVVPCANQQALLLTYFTYSNGYTLIPNSEFISLFSSKKTALPCISYGSDASYLLKLIPGNNGFRIDYEQRGTCHVLNKSMGLW